MEIRIAAARKTLEDRAAQAWESVTRRQERAYWKAAWLGISGWTVFAGGYAAALLLVMHSASPADVLVLVTLTAALRTQAEGTVWASLQVADGMHLIECFDQVTSALWQPPAPPGAAPVEDLFRLREGIRLRQVSFTYPGTASAVLHDLDLDLPSGTTIAVVGEHGSGKTTLMKLLCGLYRPTTGSITADGTPLTRLPTTAGFQDFARFAFVARESVGVGDLSALNVDSRLEQAMADGGATDFIARLSAGLDTRLGTEFDGVDLSGGQWQRVALSRAAMPGAPLLCVLDEPTAALDARGEYETYTHQMRLARRWAAVHGTITVIVSHRFWTVRAADWIVVLSHGRVTEQGTHDDLMASGGTYADLYTLQSEAYGHITRGAQCPPTPKPA
jgi:ATP-binding cassette subfamily B protein